MARGSTILYYAVKKVFVKFFAKFFEVFAKFFKVFASFLRFSRAFRGFRIHSDPLGCIRMHSEAIGSVWTFSKNFEIFWIFESFFNVSGRNFYKRLFSRHNIESDTSQAGIFPEITVSLTIIQIRASGFPLRCRPLKGSNRKRDDILR